MDQSYWPFTFENVAPGLHQDGTKIIGLAVLVFAQDQDAVAIRHRPGRCPKPRNPAARFAVERLRVVAQDVLA